MQGFPFEELPIELQAHIIQQTDDVTYRRLSQVSQSIRALSQSPVGKLGRGYFLWYLDGHNYLTFLKVVNTKRGCSITKEIIYHKVDEGYIPDEIIPWYQGRIDCVMSPAGHNVKIKGQRRGFIHRLNYHFDYGCNTEQVIEVDETVSKGYRKLIEYTITSEILVSYKESGPNTNYWFVEHDVDDEYKVIFNPLRNLQPPSWKIIRSLISRKKLPRPTLLLNRDPLTREQLITIYRAIPLTPENTKLLRIDDNRAIIEDKIAEE